MSARPNDLEDVYEGQTIRPQWKWKPRLGSATIASVAYTSDPTGLTFASSSTTGDSNTTAAVTISGFKEGNTYVVKSTMTDSAGLVHIEPVRIRCKKAGEV